MVESDQSHQQYNLMCVISCHSSFLLFHSSSCIIVWRIFPVKPKTVNTFHPKEQERSVFSMDSEEEIEMPLGPMNVADKLNLVMAKAYFNFWAKKHEKSSKKCNFGAFRHFQIWGWIVIALFWMPRPLMWHVGDLVWALASLAWLKWWMVPLVHTLAHSGPLLGRKRSIFWAFWAFSSLPGGHP